LILLRLCLISNQILSLPVIPNQYKLWGELWVDRKQAADMAMRRTNQLTAHRCDVNGGLPSKAFMKWQPDKNKTRRHVRPTTASPQAH
jgi:hypothetical protein